MRVELNHVKEHHRRLILQTIYERRYISRAEIARLTGLSRPLVSEAVSELLRNGLVAEVRKGESTGGRRPVLLQLQDNGYTIAGVEIRGNEVVGILTDLRGHIRRRDSQDLEGRCGKGAVEILISLLGRLLTAVEHPLLGIGISSPGLVDRANGTILYAANLQWENVPIASLLSTRFGYPVYVANDADAAAMGELIFGSIERTFPLVVVMLGEGIGAGILIGGRIFSGRLGAGELGHVIVVPEGDFCTCGKRGCLETVASVKAFTRRVQSLAPNSGSSLHTRIKEGGFLPQLVREAAEAGDKLAMRLIHDLGEAIGAAIGYLINLLNPAQIVIGGPLSALGSSLLEAIRESARAHSLDLFYEDTRIVLSSLGFDAGVLGAVSLVLQHEILATMLVPV